MTRQTALAVRTAAANASRKKYPEKSAARRRVQHAIRTGKLVRPTICPKCGFEGMIEASHNSYEGLDIEWLCRSCHAKKDAWMRRKPRD